MGSFSEMPGVTCVTVLNVNAENHDGKRTFTRAASQGQQQTKDIQ